MNFLQICQRARERCGMQGTGPSAVTGQTGEYLKLVNWVNESWLEIQLHWAKNETYYWQWMRGEFSFTTILDQQSYLPANFSPAVTDCRFFLENTLRQYLTSGGRATEGFMTPWDYADFRNTHMFGVPAAAPPVDFCHDMATGAIVVNKPVAGYTIYGQYVKHATEMAANADVPAMPASYHMLIVYRTMMKYGIAKAAQETYVEGENAYNFMMDKLISEQAVQLQDALPLVG